MLTSIFLNVIANISILTTASYIFVKLIPKKKIYTLSLSQRLWMIGLSGVTSSILMLFSVKLPENVILDFRHIILILLVYYFGSSVSIPMALLLAALRLLWGINPGSIRTASIYIVLGLVLPYVCKKLMKWFNRYAILLMLNAICVSTIALNLFLLYDDILVSTFICLTVLILSSSVVIAVTLFIEDLIRIRSLFFKRARTCKSGLLNWFIQYEGIQ